MYIKFNYKIIFCVIFTFVITLNMSINVYAKWQKLEIIDKEEVEKLSFFDRLAGKKAEVKRTYKKVYRWLPDPYNEDYYIVNDFAFIPVDENLEPDKEGYAYKYYFDEQGYLITDNITNDFNVVDAEGREIDSDLRPKYYFIGEEKDSKQDVYIANKEEEFTGTPSDIILSPGVVLRNKVEKIFNNLIKKDMSLYINGGSGYQNDVKGTIYTKAKWIHAIKLSGNGAFISFENRVNNFNKVTGKIATEYINTSERTTNCSLYVYDKELFDKGELDEYIFTCDNFNYSNFEEFTFTFDRRIKALTFVLYVEGKYTSRNCFLKDMKFGFSKSAYKSLLEKIEDERQEAEDEAAWEAYIDSLVEMGVYTREVDELEIIDEDGELLDEIEDEIDSDDDYYDSEEYHDELLNRHSGPAFDENLINIEDVNIGPYFSIIGTKSNTNKRKNGTKIKYAN